MYYDNEYIEYVKEYISIVVAAAEIRRRRIVVAIANIQLLKKKKYWVALFSKIAANMVFSLLCSQN